MPILISFLILLFVSLDVGAQISLESTLRDSSAVDYAKVKIRNGGELLLISRRGQYRYYLDVYGVDGFWKILKSIEIPSSAVFMASSLESNLVAFSGSDGVWHVGIFEDSLAINKYLALEKFSVIGSSIETDFGYVMAGRSRDNTPMFVMLDRQLGIINHKYFGDMGPGEAIAVHSRAGQVDILINADNGISKLYGFSNDLKILRVAAIGGAAASVVYSNGNYVAVYSADDYVFIEKIKGDGEAVEGGKLLRRRGYSGLRFNIHRNLNNYSVIGFNDGSLVVIDVSSDGKINAFFNDSSGVGLPKDGDYAVLHGDDGLHIFGKAVLQEGGAEEVVFHLLKK